MGDGTDRIAILETSLRYEPDTASFSSLLHQASKQEQLDALERIATATDLGNPKIIRENFLRKVELLTDSVAPMPQMETLLVEAAAGDPAVFPILLDRVCSREKRDEALVFAAGSYRAIDQFACGNIETLLKQHEVSDDSLFRAMEAAVIHGGVPQLETLVAYAGRRKPDLLNRETSEGGTLFERTITNRNLHIDFRDTILNILLDAGAKPTLNVGDMDIATALAEEAFPPPTRRKIEAAFRSEGIEMPQPATTQFARILAPEPKVRSMTATEESEGPRNR